MSCKDCKRLRVGFGKMYQANVLIPKLIYQSSPDAHQNTLN
jgi:hypothetical protein